MSKYGKIWIRENSVFGNFSRSKVDKKTTGEIKQKMSFILPDISFKTTIKIFGLASLSRQQMGKNLVKFVEDSL